MTSEKSLPSVVFVLGPPGAGKVIGFGRIFEIIEKNGIKAFKYTHLSAGELLRTEQDRPGSAEGQLIRNHIVNGTIVPVEITLRLLHRAMIDSGNDRFLIDGFPRNEDNLTGWIKGMSDKADVKFVLFLNCSIEVCSTRCLGRGENSGRDDDNLQVLRKRIETYHKSTLPIVNHYREKGMVREVDASKSLDEVWKETECCFREIHS